MIFLQDEGIHESLDTGISLDKDNIKTNKITNKSLYLFMLSAYILFASSSV